MQVKVLNVYRTSIGVVAILDFPKGIIPRINMELKKGEYQYCIKGVSFNQPDPLRSLDNTSYSCVLSFDQGSMDIGDILELNN